MSGFKNKTVKRVMHKLFSSRLDLKLIALVKTHPVLYDYNEPKYMDFNTREVAWQKIGDEMEKPATDCKIRWINIRDVHRRILRKNLCGIGRPARPYKYDKQLDFMRSFYKEVVTANPDSEEEDNEATEKCTLSWNDVAVDYDSEPEDKKPPKKMKKSKKMLGVNKFEEVEVSNSSAANDTMYECNYDASDPVDAFLMSIGASMKRFSPYHLNLAKSKIFQIVQEHDLQQIVEKQPEPPYYPA